MRSRQGLWALSALVQSLYPRAAAAQNVDCDQMGGTYTASIHEFTTKCDTSSVNGNIFAYYSDGDTFADCIDRCDAVDICVAALYLAGSGDCALLNAYQGDRPFNGNDLAIKLEAATTSTTDISTTDVSTTDVSTTDVTTTDVTTTDVTTTDATTTDVTTTDATTTDATTTDATTTDVTTTDVSTTDVSTTDASTTDASTTTASDAQTTTLSTTDSTTASDAGATTTSQTTSESSDTSSTQSTTSIVQTSDAPTSPSASSTPARNIPVVDDYIYTGCLSSREGYPSFVGVATDPQMTTEKCIKLAAGSKYIGIYQESCYKADSLSETEPVADERCDLVCPGDHSLFCGNTGDGRRLFGRAVAATRLLTLYRQKVASVSSASLSTIVTDSETVPAYDSTITKTASAGHLTVSCSTASDETSTSTELAEMVTTVTYATINPTNPAGLITTCVSITLLYSPCNCEHQLYPTVDMTTVTYTQASETITLTIPKAALESGNESDAPHPIIQYPSSSSSSSSSWNKNHQTDAASEGYSMAQPTAGWREDSQSDTPTSPSQSSDFDQGQGSSEPHDAPDNTVVVVTAEASRLQLHFWIATIAIMGLVMG
ncbi:hypothetical protein CC79DRAFT_1402170 [Sarocladium strictum]